MVILELRDAAYDDAFELLEEAKHHAKNTKMALCELEDAMHECYEASKDDEFDDSDIEFRKYGRRTSYRHDDHYIHDDEDGDMNMRSSMRRSRRRGLRMRSMR